MALPTSPSNNQVHKEGNRAFVYDSTLGVWDQVKEQEKTSFDMSLSQNWGEVSSNVSFPTGHVLQFKHNFATQQDITSSATGTWAGHHDLEIPILRTAGTKLWMQVVGGSQDGEVTSRTFPVDIGRSTGATWTGTSETRFGNGTNGLALYGKAQHSVIPHSYGCVDEAAITGWYTYRPVYRSNDTGSVTFQMTNSGTMWFIMMEFVV